MATLNPRLSGGANSTTSALTPIPESPHPHRRSPVESDSFCEPRNTPSCDGEPTRRNSAFLEVGLGGEDAIVDSKLRRGSRPKLQVRFRSKVDVVEPEAVDWPEAT